jgi:hypothetical protein
MRVWSIAVSVAKAVLHHSDYLHCLPQTRSKRQRIMPPFVLCHTPPIKQGEMHKRPHIGIRNILGRVVQTFNRLQFPVESTNHSRQQHQIIMTHILLYVSSLVR